MINLKKTDSKIVEPNSQNPNNNSSLEQFEPNEKVKSDNAHEIVQLEDDNNTHQTEMH